MSRNTCRMLMLALLLLAACSSTDTSSESRSPEPSGSAEPQVNQSTVTADQSSTTSTTTTPLEIRDTATFRAVRVRYFQISDRSFVCGWYFFGPASVCTEIVEVGQFTLGDGPSPWTEVRPGEFNTDLLDISGLLDDNNLLTIQAVEVSSSTEIHSWECNRPGPSPPSDARLRSLTSGHRILVWGVVDTDIDVDLDLASPSDIAEICALGHPTTINAFGAVDFE